MSDPLRYPHEPYQGGWGLKDELDRFLRWAMDLGCSDVKFTPTDPVSVRLSGKWSGVTNKVPSSGEVMLILENVTGDHDSGTHMKAGRAVDRAYAIYGVGGDRRSGWIRMRVNATSCHSSTDSGVSVTMRFIPDKIMTLEEQGVPEELLRHFYPHHGLISISGVMGSGKTTLLAAVIQSIRQQFPRSVMTLEKPIEFDLTTINDAVGPIEQMEVPGMIQTFADGVISSTRKAVDVLLLGETNDRATMEAMVQAAEVGIAVYHTVHTMSVSAIPSRIIHNFSEDEAPGIAVSFLSASRLMVQQRLVPKVNGGRIPLREWVALDDGQRQYLIEQPIHRIQPELEKIVQDAGHSLLMDAREKFEQGLIPKIEYDRVLQEKKTA